MAWTKQDIIAILLIVIGVVVYLFSADTELKEKVVLFILGGGLSLLGSGKR